MDDRDTEQSAPRQFLDEWGRLPSYAHWAARVLLALYIMAWWASWRLALALTVGLTIFVCVTLITYAIEES